MAEFAAAEAKKKIENQAIVCVTGVRKPGEKR
jgi:hypothetical protein